MTSSMNSGTPPVRSPTPSDHLVRQGMALGDFPDHLPNLPRSSGVSVIAP